MCSTSRFRFDDAFLVILSSHGTVFSSKLFNWPIKFLLQAELGKPRVSHPDQGKVYIYVECSPTAEPSFEVAYMDSVYLFSFIGFVVLLENLFPLVFYIWQ